MHFMVTTACVKNSVSTAGLDKYEVNLMLLFTFVIPLICLLLLCVCSQGERNYTWLCESTWEIMLYLCGYLFE